VPRVLKSWQLYVLTILWMWVWKSWFSIQILTVLLGSGIRLWERWRTLW
jgi:hypothetical protein